MASDSDNDLGFSTPMPPGARATCGILVVQYMDEDGVLGYGTSVRGEESLSAFVGLLERAKFDLLVDDHNGT